MRAKFRPGIGICRLKGPKARAKFPLPRGNQCGVGPMVWRRFCFWGSQSFDRFGGGQWGRFSVVNLFVSVAAFIVAPLDEDGPMPIGVTVFRYSEI